MALAPLFLRDLDVPVLVEKDVNVMAIAEQRGPLRDARDLLMVKASTGIGVGIVSGGALQRGSLFAAGELGHIPLREDTGVLCRCGQNDCLEAIAGGWAMVKALQQSGRDVHHVRDVVAIAVKGDPEALGMIRDSGRRIGEVLSAAVTLLNPEVVVIGGDLAGACETFVAGCRETVYQRSTTLATRKLRIVASTFGERQGLVGCAAMINQWITSEQAVDSAVAGLNRFRHSAADNRGRLNAGPVQERLSGQPADGKPVALIDQPGGVMEVHRAARTAVRGGQRVDQPAGGGQVAVRYRAKDLAERPGWPVAAGRSAARAWHTRPPAAW